MPDDVLEVGDVLRMSVQLIDVLQERDEDLLVRVHRIERQEDGTVKLWLENADATPKVLQ